MARTIKERDQHCAWPGCSHSRHLHIHHIKHWADGGETSIEGFQKGFQISESAGSTYAATPDPNGYTRKYSDDCCSA